MAKAAKMDKVSKAAKLATLHVARGTIGGRRISRNPLYRGPLSC